ncbi:unnamed protein product, partial [Musa acuminata subsp. malaccensis]
MLQPKNPSKFDSVALVICFLPCLFLAFGRSGAQATTPLSEGM